MSGFTKFTTKALAIAGLAIGISAMSFAQSTSVVSTMNNQSAVSNTALSVGNVTAANKGLTTGKTGGYTGGSTGKTTGGKTGGTTGGHNPPGCVPEPLSMLSLGIGAGMVFLKKRAKKA